MSTLSSLPPAAAVAAAASLASVAVASRAAVASPSSTAVAAAAAATVSLSGAQAANAALTYSSTGVVANDAQTRRPVWERASGDLTSTKMAANARAGDLATRWSGLGRALMDGVANGATDYSQSILVSNEAMQGSSGVQAILRDQLHKYAANSVALSVTTASGARVELSLSSDGKGIAVQARVAEGKLDDNDRAALAKLGDAFQGAIDGLAQQPPVLALDGLMKFDSTQFSAIDLHASMGAGAEVIDLHADARQRKLSVQGAAGTMQVAVDVSNTSMVGSAAQQQRALANIASQVDAAVRRGHGDASLASLFKDGLSQLNSSFPGQSAASAPAAAVLPNAFDRQLLSGLADFKASITQSSASPNPLRPDEQDGFAYQLSQQTTASGRGQADRHIVQQQQSSLRAAYHESLQPDLPLKLGTDRQSQNYTYHQIDDQASSTMDIAYTRGYLTRALLSQSARQDTHVSKYVQGDLVQDTRTPLQSAIVRDFAAQLQEGLAADRDAKPGSQAGWRQLLQQIGADMLLQADPTELKLRAGRLALSADAA